MSRRLPHQPIPIAFMRLPEPVVGDVSEATLVRACNYLGVDVDEFRIDAAIPHAVASNGLLVTTFDAVKGMLWVAQPSGRRQSGAVVIADPARSKRTWPDSSRLVIVHADQGWSLWLCSPRRFVCGLDTWRTSRPGERYRQAFRGNISTAIAAFRGDENANDALRGAVIVRGTLDEY